MENRPCRDYEYIENHPEEYMDIWNNVHSAMKRAYETEKNSDMLKVLKPLSSESIEYIIKKASEEAYWKTLIEKGLMNKPNECGCCPFAEGFINGAGRISAKCSIAFNVVQFEEIITPIWRRKVVPDWCPLKENKT